MTSPLATARAPFGRILTAMVTPFTAQGELDLDAAQNVATYLVDNGNDGLVVMPDGTKYVSSVREGGVSMIPPGGESTLIATGIPSAASMCYNPTANALFIPMNNNNAVAIVPLD